MPWSFYVKGRETAQWNIFLQQSDRNQAKPLNTERGVSIIFQTQYDRETPTQLAIKTPQLHWQLDIISLLHNYLKDLESQKRMLTLEGVCHKPFPIFYRKPEFIVPYRVCS